MRHVLRAMLMLLALRGSLDMMSTDPWKGVGVLLLTMAFGVYIGWVMREEAKG